MSVTSLLSPTRPKPTARPSGSFRPPCASGPTDDVIDIPESVRRTCQNGCIAITGIHRRVPTRSWTRLALTLTLSAHTSTGGTNPLDPAHTTAQYEAGP